MTAHAVTHPTLRDLANRMDQDGSIAQIIEILAQTNEVLDSMVWVEGNLPTGHRTTVRTGLPAPTWRRLYGGVQPSVSRTAQITDTVGMLEAYAEVDKALADLNGNTGEFRLSEDRAFIEGMNQEFCRTLFYGNESTQPEAFTGLAPRFNTRSLTAAATAEHVLHGTGAPDGADQTSIWLVGWGENTVHGIYPKGSPAGLFVEDKGQVTVENIDGSGGRMEAYRTHYRWDCGLSVRDWRYVVRIANIDVGQLTRNAATGSDLIDLMTQALELIPIPSQARLAFYCNRTVRSFLRRQIANRVAASTLTVEEVAGRRVVFFSEAPVYRVDAILSTEAIVPAV